MFVLEYFLKTNLMISLSAKKNSMSSKNSSGRGLEKPSEQIILIKNGGLTEFKRKFCDQLCNSPSSGYTR